MNPDQQVQPRNNPRGDAEILRSVESALQWMPHVPLERVKVSVSNGWITLSGDVDWPYQTQSTARWLLYLAGVTGVSDQVEIKAGSQRPADSSQRPADST